ncbi:MAG: YjiH family protein [Erysipelotrichaceae bacterium]|nr:YjiH family protein [Erysipelotrichaceae bacterium]
MDLFKEKRFYKFLIPSIIGCLLFVTPLQYQGQLTIPIAVLANTLLDVLSNSITTIIWFLITISGTVTCIHRFYPITWITMNPRLQTLFEIRGFWFYVRIVGMIFVNMLYFHIGPAIIVSDITGFVVLHDLLPILVCVFLLAGFLLALLLDFGLLDFFGALLIKVMRPIFNLPGRGALDCVASWLGDGSIGVLLTSKQYEEGFYSKREATVIATTFSFVSITFCLVVLTEVHLEQYFFPFYLIVSLSGIVAAIIVPKLPPLSKVPDTYAKDIPHSEDIPSDMTSVEYGLQMALDKADHSPSVMQFIKEGIYNVLDMWLGTLPVILAMGTIALIIAEYTPIFTILGLPFIPLYELLQIPEAALASQTVIVGFADMFLPSVIASTIESDITRFVIAATSVTQLIYMSEIGSIIMGSKIPVSLVNLFIIFLERTIVTLPVIALFAHIIF